MDAREEDNITHHDSKPSAGDEVGEAAGGITGVVTGAAIGSLGGPIGTVVGGIAGALGGWWAGRAIAGAAESFTGGDDEFYRSHYESSDARLADRSYDDVRPAYQLGHLAARNPDYSGKPFESVESDLRRGWDTGASSAHGEWDRVKGYSRDAYNRTAGSAQNATSANTDQQQNQQQNQQQDQRLREEANDAANLDAKRLDDSAGYKSF